MVELSYLTEAIVLENQILFPGQRYIDFRSRGLNRSPRAIFACREAAKDEKNFEMQGAPVISASLIGDDDASNTVFEALRQRTSGSFRHNSDRCLLSLLQKMR